MPNALITPPRVPLIDPRTGLIDRAWYLFFLSLNTAANLVNDNPDVGPSVESQIATYDAALQTLAQEVGTQPQHDDAVAEIQKQIEALAVGPVSQPQVLWSDVITQPKIEAYDTSVSIALTTTPALLKPASVMAGNSGIVYDAATGEFTFSAAGSYSLAIGVNATATAANQFVHIYAENNTGAGWVVNTNSGKSYELSNANTVQIVYSQAIGRVAGQKVRYWIYSNDIKVALTTKTLPGGVGAIVPAIRIQYS